MTDCQQAGSRKIPDSRKKNGTTVMITIAPQCGSGFSGLN